MSLEIKQLSAGYGRQKILKNVDLAAVKGGSCIGVIGPNASGKSTLFKTISGILKPMAGEVLLNDQKLHLMRRKERARRVAYMPQAYGCNAALTVFESVLLALKQTTGWRVEAENLEQVAKTLSDLGLAHLGDRGLGNLSGGQAQMVAMAQTLVRAPEVVLLDEPTSALDLHHQLSVMTAVAEFAAIVVLAALHDLNLAAEFCDRLVLIREGQILADGGPEDILAMEEIGETYRVKTSLETTRRGSFYVDARLGG
jgi:iron complex transport system ATP-binding protein